MCVDMVADWMPRVGMEFNPVEEAFGLWVNYGTRTGFSVRKQYANKSKVHGEVTSRRFVCSNEGNPKGNRQYHPPQHPWAERRTNCPVRMGISFIRESGKYLVPDFVAEHNHVLYLPPSTHLVPLEEKILQENCLLI